MEQRNNMSTVSYRKKLDFLLSVINATDLGEFLEESKRLHERVNKCKYSCVDNEKICKKCGSYHILKEFP